MPELNSKNVAQAIFDNWDVYDLVLEHNCMFHKEIYADVARILSQHFSDKPFSVLDLGCGSARYVAETLCSFQVSSYTGCDLSEAALAQARRNLSALN